MVTWEGPEHFSAADDLRGNGAIGAKVEAVRRSIVARTWHVANNVARGMPCGMQRAMWHVACSVASHGNMQCGAPWQVCRSIVEHLFAVARKVRATRAGGA